MSHSNAVPVGTGRFTGTPSPARRAAGLPGHCDACVLTGHQSAHPDLGCADVGCDVVHGTTDTGLPLCADCGLPITGRWLSDLPLPGESSAGQLRYWHTSPSACAAAAS
ncbi:hypothetical protein GCM10010495_74130 [Kitasatospora herbaricolor]|uniref:hypothetical protein n=1 Tax=Kitasatospora herbaricolor TaxID=68217 RepID=UPI00174BD52C|nr:hypothetical protein [Kitasatospora herbaricolor]MDQ0305465.1 hypothetical protein [Kitasatospora herbaricolor]GGV45706.1 hypothetical protein GCM10010495_74130 [Kitasatospora herbaricolor]